MSDGVETDPDGHDLAAGNGPLGEAVMPGRRNVGPRFLDEQLVVEMDQRPGAEGRVSQGGRG